MRRCRWCLSSARSARPSIAHRLAAHRHRADARRPWRSLFALLGKNPLSALYVYFLEPLTDAYSLQEIVVKATPLVLIAVGLSLCYLANVWNIGAEGQFLDRRGVRHVGSR